MAIVTTDNAHYGDIAAAIREKAGGTALYKPSEMAAAIRAIQAGGGSGGGAVNFAPFSQIVWGTITPATDLSGMIPASMFGLESVPNIQFYGIQIVAKSPANNGNILYAAAYSENKTTSGGASSKIGTFITKNGQGSGKILVEWGNNFFVSQTLGAGETYRYMICVE